MNTKSAIILWLLVALGVASTAYYFSWWFEEDRLSDPALLLLLGFMVFYLSSQAFFVWFIYLHARRPHLPPSPSEGQYTVDVFVPTYDEPLPLIEKTLRSVIGIRYPHTTYVIDDGRDDMRQTLALSVGARYIRRNDNEDYKAGNINNALSQSSGELIVIFDIDHIPEPDFIDRVTPYFSDSRVGVVQVALDHYNLDESFIAAASGRMNDEFFAATMHGMDRLGCAVVFGSNAVFRRAALDALGGYKPGLAEDLSTSIHLHATGWKSAYVPAILAKGLVPADLEAFYKQQFKWARGVFEVLLSDLPRLFPNLTGNQRICYATRMTYYVAGPVMAAHILMAIAVPFLSTSLEPVGEYVRHSLPFVITYLTIHVFAYRTFALKDVVAPVDFRNALLVLASWPVYTLAFISAVLRREPKFVSTPKEASRGTLLRLIVPQMVAVLLLVISLVTHIQTSTPFDWQYLFLVIALIGLHWALVPAILTRRGVAGEGARTFDRSGF